MTDKKKPTKKTKATSAAKTPKKTGAKRGRPKKKVGPKKTYIALVIDRSGSMGSVKDAAFSGINEQIKTIRDNAALSGETSVTYIQFDHEIETVFDKKKAEELLPITTDQYVPRGYTALYDAVWLAIQNLKTNVVETDDTGYLVIVISDGHENASKLVTQSQLLEETKKLEATGKWTFTYMLSNVDINVVRQTLGVATGNIVAYDSTTSGTVQAFTMSSTSTSGYMATRGKGITAVNSFYVSPDDKTDSDPDKDSK